jgi:hypothetical protein
LYLASDLEILSIFNSLPLTITKRLRSSDETTVRGAIYEVNVAAGVLRAGYAIKWLAGDAMPEFTIASEDGPIDFEVKRRNRNRKQEYDTNVEMRALRQNFRKALKKKTTGKYVIFLDTDLPPAMWTKYIDELGRIAEALASFKASKTAIIVTHSGHEYISGLVDSGDTSTAAFLGEGSASRREVSWIIENIYAKLPPAYSEEWEIS